MTIALIQKGRVSRWRLSKLLGGKSDGGLNNDLSYFMLHGIIKRSTCETCGASIMYEMNK